MRADAVHSTSVALEFAVHAEANEVPKVVAFEPRWVHVAYEGKWRGYRTGEFTFTPSDLRQMVANLRTSPQYRPNSLGVTKEQILGGQYGVIRFDFRHLSEMPPAEVPIGHQVAFGWVLEAEVRTANEPGDASGVRAKSEKAEFWVFGYFGNKAADMINNHEIKWLSITAYPNSTDKVTAANVGWWVSSIALTPAPFLEGLTALPFQAEHDVRMEQQAVEAEREAHKSKITDRPNTESVGTKNNERPSADDNGSKNVDRKNEGKMFKFAKKTMEMLGMKPDNEDMAEMSVAVDKMCMEHDGMAKKLADMTAKCAEYEKQFGALKKTCGDANMADGQIVVMLAEAMSAKARFEAEAPRFKIVLDASIESEKLNAKADIDRVMAEKQIAPEMRDAVESFRVGGISDDKLATPEALAVRLEARKVYLSKYPNTGEAAILGDILGGKGNTHIDTGVQASAQNNTQTQAGVGFGTPSRPGTQGSKQPKTIMLSDENRVNRPINLHDFKEPGAEFNAIMCAVTVLKALHPTKYSKAQFGSVAWDELNQEAYQVVLAAEKVGAV